ncbi:hypothetical protein [Povalibacter sp.]|uniref:hypothetical protein n=1 Tax=Povalibacter sp. TaxID=1962978 RepID=UPI002F3EF3E7
MSIPRTAIELLSRRLQDLYSLILATERQFKSPASGLALLDQLINDPAWAWLRPLSLLTAEIDHVLHETQAPTQYDHAIVASHIRGLLFGEGDLRNDTFLERYRPLLHLNPELAGAHGQLRSLVKSAPEESADEAERLHARHQWSMRAKHKHR